MNVNRGDWQIKFCAGEWLQRKGDPSSRRWTGGKRSQEEHQAGVTSDTQGPPTGEQAHNVQ